MASILAAPLQIGAQSVDLPPDSPLRQIKHVVVVVQENHTFDNFFGTFPGVNGVGLDQVPHCTNARTPAGARCQYVEEDIPFYWRLARAYGVSDNYFTAVNGPSYPNHLMMLAAEAPILTDTAAWQCPQSCFNLPSLPQMLTEHGRAWQVYREGASFDPTFTLAPVYAQRQNHPVRSIADFSADAAAGKLPAVAWVKPPLDDSEHPATGAYSGAPVDRGSLFVKGIVDAAMASPDWASTVILITWDDFGYLYDHVSPPATELLSDALGDTATIYGPRVPLLIVSPLARRGYVSHEFASHLSIVRFIESVFGLPPLNARDAAASNLSDFFDPAASGGDLVSASVPSDTELLSDTSMEPSPRAQAMADHLPSEAALPGQWYQYNLNEVDRMDCARAHSGSCALRMEGQSGGQVKTLFQSHVELLGGGGDTYVFSGWSAAEGAEANRYQLAIIVRNGTDQNLYQAQPFSGGTHDWEQTSVAVTVPGPYAQVDVYAQYGGATGTVWFDDFSLTRVAP